MRRLPVYLLIDVSGSMMGEPIEQVKNGVRIMLSALRSDPYALETASLSLIAFHSSAEQLVPLTELTAIQPPEMKAGGTTALGEGLRLVADCAACEVRKSTEMKRGDWKPMVFIMTDGAPTDDWKAGLQRFREERWGTVVACSVNNADTDVLREIAGDAVLHLDSADASSLAAFFKWVSASISSGSQKIESGGGDIEGLEDLPPPPPEIKVVI